MAQPCIIITGANGGIGQALVTAFTHAGYAVMATSGSPKADGLDCEYFIQADLDRTVRDADYGEKIFAEIRKAIKKRPLKGLINNAAVQILAKVEELDRAAWQKTLNVNLLAPFFWTQAFISELEAARGCVINIGSIHSRLTKRRFTAYATSKAALNGMTRSIALELGTRVRINAIEPAAISTEMLRSGFAGNERGLAQLEEFHPTGKIGQPEEIGRLALQMIDDGLDFMNGSIITLDGGISGCLSDPA